MRLGRRESNGEFVSYGPGVFLVNIQSDYTIWVTVGKTHGGRIGLSHDLGIVDLCLFG